MEAVTIETRVRASYEAVLSNDQRSQFQLRLETLRETCMSADSTPTFLAEYANSIVDLFAASTVAIWFATPEDKSKLQRKVNVGGKNLALDEVTAPAHELLLQYVTEHGKSFAVQPFSAPEAMAAVSNPTDSFLLLAPIQFMQQDVAVLEIALGPKPLRRPHQELVSSYLSWLDWLSGLLQVGLERSFARSDEPMVLAMDCLSLALAEAVEIQSQLRLKLENRLQHLSGKNFGTLASNQAIAKQVHALLDSKGLRVQCPECNSAAILRCQKAGNSKTGVFTFDHYLDSGRTFHGGTTSFPKLVLVEKPPRRSKKS